MLLPEAMLDFFILVMKKNGGGEYLDTGNRFSSNRQPFGDGYILFDNPTNGHIRISATIDMKNIEQIWQDAMVQLQKKIDDDKENSQEKD